MSVSFILAPSVSLPVLVSQGGTGLTSPGSAGNVLTSTGAAWTSSSPVSVSKAQDFVTQSTGVAYSPGVAVDTDSFALI